MLELFPTRILVSRPLCSLQSESIKTVNDNEELVICTLAQYGVPAVYKELLDILTETGNMELLKFLHISFAFPPSKLERKERSFEFEKTFRFSNLSKLVVHGKGADNS